MKEPLEDLVRRVDQDRWLSSRFAPAPVRKRLVGLYAVNYEIAHIGESSSEPSLGAIRLQFWADAIAALYENGAAPAQPAVTALGDAIESAHLPRALFDSLIEARKRDLESAPFDTWADLEAYLDATSGGVIDLATRICAPALEPDAARDNLIRAAGRAWGYVGLVRAFPYWTARRRTFFPKRVREHVRLNEEALFSGAAPDHAAVSAVREVLDRATGALRDVRRFSPAGAKEMFPAMGYVALVESYVRDAAAAPGFVRDLLSTSLMARQFRLVGAAATGAI